MLKSRLVTDMLGREVRVPAAPQRIVSLCPSITETLFALGLDAQIAGLTRYCIHPADRVTTKVDVGGTKKLKFDAIEALNPDLIIAEKEENRREDVERLAEHWPVYVTEVRDILMAHAMIRRVGLICARAEQGDALSAAIKSAWQDLPVLVTPQRVAYLIWRKPWMAAGSDTFIDAVLQRLGFANVFAGADRYPQFSAEELAVKQPAHVLLSSEPFPFVEKHTEEIQALLPDAKVQLVDGEMFSWYGARMREAADYLKNFLAGLDR